ncbi:putative lipid II flippase FtsW [Candidatus Kaiserbacteria bacterium]|nr:putative lipid II flippase FtsW [Candidatus Kaiserbacteria bacterium]
MARKLTSDRILFGIVLVLVLVGFLIFSSASLGLLAREGARFSSVAFNQFAFGIVGGFAAMYVTSSVHYRTWRKYAFYIFLATLGLTALVFVPGLGFEHGGAVRWLSIGGFSFQPAELLKIGFIVYMATWLSGMYRHTHTVLKGTLPFLGILALVGIVMLLQPDTDTFAIMAASAVAMFIAAGGKLRDVGIMFVSAVVLLAILAFSRPYIMDRLTTFIDPSADPLGSSYQVQQSLIAIGSGGFSGRGFGQSIQKFEYLPEPIGDSIFAVASEEFGFIGSTLLVLLFVAFAFRGFRVATHAPDLFGMLLAVGFVTLITLQAFLNIAAMLSLAPLSGLPLPFISHGGTALLATLAAIGVVLNVSKYQKKRV